MWHLISTVSLEYVEIKGGMVILIADDPGFRSASKTRQSAGIFQIFQAPCALIHHPAQEAYEMIQEAFEVF